MKGKRHSDETRAAVMAALKAGEGVNATAKRFSLAKSIISRWAKEIPEEQKEQIRTQKKIDLSDLIDEYLIEHWKTQTFYLRFLRTAKGIAWIKSNSLHDFAVWCGVAQDKAVRIHAAESRAEQINLETSSELTDDVSKSVH